MKATTEDKMKIVNALVTPIFMYRPTEIPNTVTVETSVGELEFERAHHTLRGYRGIVPGSGVVQILEQNPAKTGSWCGILANKYGLQIAWLWVNNEYDRCLIDLGDEDVLIFRADDGANATRDRVKNHPRIKEIIERHDADREAKLKQQRTLTHFN